MKNIEKEIQKDKKEEILQEIKKNSIKEEVEKKNSKKRDIQNVKETSKLFKTSDISINKDRYYFKPVFEAISGIKSIGINGYSVFLSLILAQIFYKTFDENDERVKTLANKLNGFFENGHDENVKEIQETIDKEVKGEITIENNEEKIRLVKSIEKRISTKNNKKTIQKILEVLDLDEIEYDGKEEDEEDEGTVQPKKKKPRQFKEMKLASGLYVTQDVSEPKKKTLYLYLRI
jgi:hypothetical protein